MPTDAELRAFFLGRARHAAGAHRDGLPTEYESANEENDIAGGQALLCFRYVLHQPLAHWQLDQVVPSDAHGHGGRRLYVAKNLGLVEPTKVESRNPLTGRWTTVWQVNAMGRLVASGYGCTPIEREWALCEYRVKKATDEGGLSAAS